jgi:hypothetical protein
MSEVTDQELAQAFEQAETPEAQPETSSEQPEIAVTETPDGEAAPAAPRAPLSLKDDDLVEVKIDGKTVQMSWREIAQTKAMLPGAFTKKTQELAEQRRQVEAQAAQYQQYRQQAEQQVQAAQLREQQMQAYLRDPQKLAALYLAAQAQGSGQPQAGQGIPSQPQPQAFDPNQLRQQILGEAQQFVQQTLAAQAQEARQKAAADALELEFTSHTQKLLEQQPILAKMRGLSNTIYGEVVAMGPRSVEEAKQFAATIVDEYVELFKSQVTTAQKVAAVSAAKATNGIAPKGSGQGSIAPVAKQYNKKKGLNDPELEKDVLSYLNSLGGE